VKKILIVDDEPDINTILVTFLKACGYEAVGAKDGVEAIDLAHAESPHLILLDVMMPEMSGYQVARLLKDDPATKDIPVIMLTAKTQQSDRFWGLESGAAAYMHKPFELSDVLSHVRALIGE
jgi:DNA-binding response OmpR family regulator